MFSRGRARRKSGGEWASAASSSRAKSSDLHPPPPTRSTDCRAAVVVWFGAVAYYLLILRPALRRSGVDRKAQYAILAEIRARLKRVVGVAVLVLVGSGLTLARLRGLLGGGVPVDPVRLRLFHVKLAVAALLVLVFLTALPLLRRVRTPKRRGRLFVATHVLVLALGAVAAAIGVVLGR